MADRTLRVNIIGDDRQLQRAFARTDRSLTQFQGRTSRIAQSLRGGLFGGGVGGGSLLFGSGAFVSTAALTKGLSESVTAASDLNEQISRTEVVLGDSARETIEWSRTSATAFGISQRAALEANATYAGLFQTVGFGQKEAGRLSQSIVELASDLASLQNTSPEEALVALRSGLIGEAEPLRRFNIFLSEARVQQDAMAASGKKTAKELTNQEKTLARYNIILKDSAPAQGNFALTSGELANQSRILRANLDNLATGIGNQLVPALTDAAAAANFMFDAFARLSDIEPIGDPTGGQSLLELLGLDDTIKFDTSGLDVIKGVIRQFEDDEKELQNIVAAGPGLGIGRDIARREEERAREIEEQTLDANRSRRRSRRAFDALTKGLGLKLDRASLTESVNDDIAALRELERAIQRQIRREGRTFELVDRLTQVRIEISDATAQRSEQAAQDARDAWARTLDALDLNLERATDTPKLEDDLRALATIERTIIRRISQEGKTLELERELLDVRRQQAEVRRQQAEQLRQQREEERQARQGRQFQRLGLTEEGDEPVPGTGALRKRAARLEEQIKDSVLDTDKTRSRLRRIAQVLSGQFGDVGREVRQAILDMLNDITSALEGGDRRGPLTKGSGLNTLKVLEGLGLSEEQIRELRGRLSSVTATQGAQVGAQTRTTAGGFGGIQGRILVESHTTINLDGQKVASVVTRNQQRTKRRNPKQKRGPNRGL